MVVAKTLRRRTVTIAYGEVEMHETVLVCQSGCLHTDGTRLCLRDEALAGLAPPRTVFGYDVMVHVGIERYLRHRQREEIRAALEKDHGITLSAGEVSTLCLRFVTYAEGLHRSRAPALAEVLRRDGGWPLHIDATCEGGRGTLFVAMAGWRGWVLGAFKIPTERADAVLPALREVVERFGDPCAVMRDLGRAMTLAAAWLVEERKLTIPVLGCHLHFLKDVGRDLLDAGHRALQQRLREAKLSASLRALSRDLGREIGEDAVAARAAFVRWQEPPRVAAQPLPQGRDGLAVVRGLAQWTLDHPGDVTSGSFPFDCPWLRLYQRACVAHGAADALLRSAPADGRVRRALARLCRALNAVVDDESCAFTAAALRKRAEVFDELRLVLRLHPPAPGEDKEPPGLHVASEHELAQIRDVRAELERWTLALIERRCEHGAAEDTRDAIDLVLAHIERHGASLWGHAIARPAALGGGVRLVNRTNNIEETFFRDMKHGERRRSGRRNLAQDFETLPPGAALVQNLRKPDYVAVLCGTLDELPAAFARLDAQRLAAARSGVPATPVTAAATPIPAESASLPTVDRRAVRTDAMNRRVRALANTRPPRARKLAG
jgi:hypothetical protein